MSVTSLMMCVALIGAVAVSGCGRMISGEPSAPARHPVQVTERHPDCGGCHQPGDIIRSVGKPYVLFNHTPVFYREHSFYVVSGNNGALCRSCHSVSFCTDCHTTKAPMKPTIRNGSNVEYRFTHRGDYIARHRFDGHADPASCFKCHGRSNNARCRQCHFD